VVQVLPHFYEGPAGANVSSANRAHPPCFAVRPCVLIAKSASVDPRKFGRSGKYIHNGQETRGNWLRIGLSFGTNTAVIDAAERQFRFERTAGHRSPERRLRLADRRPRHICFAWSRMEAPKILIVDDVASLVHEIILLLRLMELDAVGAGSVDDGLALLDRFDSICVVVTDVWLAQESGFDLLPRVKNSPSLQGRNFTYFFMSGDTRIESQQGEYTTIDKPIDIPIFVKLLRNAVQQQEQSKHQ
jgi:CheY-like chemotaxis protein